MLSRVADSLFWMGRYSERTETNAHIIYTQLEHMIEHSRENSTYEIEWSTILKICGYFDDYQSRYNGYYLQKMINYLIFDQNNLNSITSTTTSIRMNARNTRDIIPNELWEEWNDLYLSIQNVEHDMNSIISTNLFLTGVRKTSLTATGVIYSRMTRDECFLFLTIGKWLERAEKTAIILSEILDEEEELTCDFISNFSLRLTHSNEEYARRTRNRSLHKVLNFLIGDLKCSRSIAYAVEKIKLAIFEVESGKSESYSIQLFDALINLEKCIQVDAGTLSKEECKEWVRSIKAQCINFGPIFSKTYYLTPPILVS